MRPCRQILALILLLAGPACADDALYERPPINYPAAKVADPVARLASAIETGQCKPLYDQSTGYLPWLLDALKIPVSSQVLVFSKTSFQRELISPARPRALYFNDEVYIGYVQGGDVLEIASTDPTNGPIFYSLRQKLLDRPKFIRQNDACLQCHASGMTSDFPGHIVRSVYPDASGLPILSAGSFRTNHTSPLKQRWGGWYVTGTSGPATHMGNVVAADRDSVEKTDFTAGTNLTTLKDRCDLSAYLSPHSDIVALMVLEHQTYIHNLITRANFLTRLALHDAREMNKVLGRPEAFLSDSAKSRLKNAAEPLVKAMLMGEEAPLSAPVKGTSDFAAHFARQGPRDSRGRSFRDLDLTRRLFKHPMSYLIHSPSFAALPPECKQQVLSRFDEILSSKAPDKDFHHLTPEDRAAIQEILRAQPPK